MTDIIERARAQSDTYARDGVVFLERALDEATMRLAEEAYEWSLANPGPGAAKLLEGTPGTFYQDLANPASFGPYAPLVRETRIPDIVAALWGSDDVWYMYEQVFLKEGGDTRRTPWHQDLPYLPVEGDDLAVMWITFDPVTAEESLEFVRGSHRGTIYDGSRFDPEDETIPLYGTGDLPRLPRIEENRADYDIVSWASAPGDVVVFHPAVLHGGAPTKTGRRRRTLSLRFFGADAVHALRPDSVFEGSGVEGLPEMAEEVADDDPTAHPLRKVRKLPGGAPFRHPDFPHVRGPD